MFDDNVPKNLPIKDDAPDNVSPVPDRITIQKKVEPESLPQPKQMPVASPSADIKDAEDIFSDLSEPRPKLNLPGSVSLSSKQYTDTTLPSGTEMTTPHQSFKKVLVTIVSIVVIVSLFIVGGYWIYNSFFKVSVSPSLELNTENIQEQVQNSAPAVIEEPVAEPTPIPKIEDKDNDGLSDQEELLLGTNPLDPDTDGDLLFDREEVEVYKTDPTNIDTDGDGYNDGSEVQNGFDPRGPGKLLKVEAQL